MKLTTFLRHPAAGLLALALTFSLVAGVPAAAQRSAPATPLDVGDELEDTLGYGIDLESGAVAIEFGKVFVHCLKPAILVVNPDLADVAKETLRADVRGDIWEIDGEKYLVQMADAVFDSKRVPETKALSKSGLPVVDADQLFHPAATQFIGCHALWQRFKCDLGPFTCPDPSICFGGGFAFGPSKQWWRCRFTNNVFDFCAERFQNVCSLNEFTCDDCTGPIVSTTPIGVSACVVLP